jgi:hypothetical protein
MGFRAIMKTAFYLGELIMKQPALQKLHWRQEEGTPTANLFVARRRMGTLKSFRNEQKGVKSENSRCLFQDEHTGP